MGHQLRSLYFRVFTRKHLYVDHGIDMIKLARESLLIGGCNIVFIVIIFILVFVPNSNDDFGSTEAVAIVSVLYCFANSVLAFYFLKKRNENSGDEKKKDYLQNRDESQQNSDENIEILVKNEGETITTAEISIELEEIKHKCDVEIEKRQTIEYAHSQIMEEFDKYKSENERLINENKDFKAQITDIETANANANANAVTVDEVKSEEAKSDDSQMSERIHKLQKELAMAQKTIIEMTSVVGVQQKFPTVQETIQCFRSIRDQKHHDCCTLLKKFIKARNGTENETQKLQKYYINQETHRILFFVLCQCYKALQKYKLRIYDQIAGILNMKCAIAQSFAESETVSNPMIQKQQIRLLSNIFGPYFKNNFKFVLDKKLYEASDEKGKENETDLLTDILRITKEKFPKYLSHLDSNGSAHMPLANGLRDYMIECSEVCWVMLLQSPILAIQPLQWRGDSHTYDEQSHKRVLGSDRNCKQILYHVWPAVAREGLILGDQKIDVVLREKLYAPFRQ